MSGLETDPFAWRITKDGRVLVSRGGVGIAVVAGNAGRALAERLPRASDDEAQHLLARATGNYRRGNERRATRR